MGDFFNTLRRFLFGWANREFLIFLVFLVVAGIFWLLTTLNEDFEQEMKIPVRFVNVPKDVVITSGEEDTLRVTIRDKGISLITYLYRRNKKPITIDFHRYADDNGKGMIPGSDILRLVNAQLPASAKAISVKPETEVFFYNNGEKKKIPVSYQGKVVPDRPYFISNIEYLPDSITIYANEDKMDSITKVYTEALMLTDFRDSVEVKARLQKIEGVKMVPDAVTIRFLTDMLTEVTIDDVPVKGINMPEGKKLRTFPAKISVSFVTGMKNYQHMSPNDFLIVADYNELNADTSAQCNVYLRLQPTNIQRVRLATDKVDYLIEELQP
ncbi:MAG: YbbR-like domain-containing protein [Prevotella sp.]|nr:YbbR-like domain-containing protein [Prevotella sp.]